MVRVVIWLLNCCIENIFGEVEQFLLYSNLNIAPGINQSTNQSINYITAFALLVMTNLNPQSMTCDLAHENAQ